MGSTAALRHDPAVATWRAMGTSVTVEVAGDPSLVDVARHRIAELELRWSRFLAGSDVGRMNTTRGLPVLVHADTRLLVRQAIAAWELTGGACDPTVLDAVVAAGYDVSFERVADRGDRDHDDAPAPGCCGIDVDDRLGAVTLPVGVGFDPGAIGKGLAADLVVDALLASGATGAFVSIGGDIRMAGTAPAGDGWLVSVRDHGATSVPRIDLAITGGAIATSTTQRRRWCVDGEPRHHVIDPATGRCADPVARTVTVLGGEAWWAEAKATELLLASPDRWCSVVGDGAAVVVERSGTVHLLGRVRDYIR